MNLEQLKKSLVLHEGMRVMMYDCPAGYKTIGVGHNLEARGITEHAAMMILEDDIKQTMDELDHAIGDWWRELPEAAALGLVELAFQIGAGGVSKFQNSLRLIKDKAPPETILMELMDSMWARQTPNRAEVVARRIATGEW